MILQKKGSVWTGLIACLVLSVLLAACSSGTPTLIPSLTTPTPTLSHMLLRVPTGSAALQAVARRGTHNNLPGEV